jgi:hypothetical protein
VLSLVTVPHALLAAWITSKVVWMWRMPKCMPCYVINGIQSLGYMNVWAFVP